MNKYYTILKISPPTTIAVLKRAYHDAAAHNHPDRGGSHQTMVEVNAAYEALKSQLERDNFRTRLDEDDEDVDDDEYGDESDWDQSDWIEIIDHLIYKCEQMEYKKGWIVHQLINMYNDIPLEAWQYLAEKLDYRAGWAWHKYQDNK